MKQTFFILLCLIISLYSNSQKLVQATVKDSETGEPLPFCNVMVKNAGKGTITNTEGEFRLSLNLDKDILEFIYLGYEKKEIPAKDLIKNKEVFLSKKSNVLNEVIVKADNDYLYDIISKCGRRINNDNSKKESKLYYALETKVGKKPTELIECYYNAKLRGYNITELLLKNGRIAFEVVGNRLVSNYETSKAVRKINLTESNSYFPSLPFHFGKYQMKNIFDLKLLYSDSLLYNISFKPFSYRIDKDEYFSGDVWINKETFLIEKIDLYAENPYIQPFISAHGDLIENVSFKISQTYNIKNKKMYPNYVIFDYQITYHSASGLTGLGINFIESSRNINAHCVLYFYDYDNSFILPYYTHYDDDITDYKKIALTPYNEYFWNNNTAILLTGDQKKSLGFSENENYSIKIQEGNYGKDFINHAKINLADDLYGWNYSYTFWMPDKRVFINKALPQNETYDLEGMDDISLRKLCDVDVGIFLDVDKYGDSIISRSYTILDDSRTYFHLEVKPYSNPFINIYFDICEIERRKMQSQIDNGNLTLKQIDKLYYETLDKLKKIENEYYNEVKLGANKRNLNKWNKYVKQHLDIDNIEMFEKYYEERQARNDSIIKSGGVPQYNIFE